LGRGDNERGDPVLATSVTVGLDGLLRPTDRDLESPARQFSAIQDLARISAFK
jgi:hypothetical protein